MQLTVLFAFQVRDSQAAELTQVQTQLRVTQTHLEHSQEQQKQAQEKLVTTESSLTSLQQQHYQTGVLPLRSCSITATQTSLTSQNMLQHMLQRDSDLRISRTMTLFDICNQTYA